MYDRMQELTRADLDRLHRASMEILRSAGVAFHEPEALDLFRRHGVRVDGKVVHLEEADVRRALESAPARFRLEARNPARSVDVGGEGVVFVPGYGVPFVTLAHGEKRPATLSDYEDFCRLVQTSSVLDSNGFLMVQPSDVAPETAHLDMLLANLLLCDKPFMGSPVSREGAADALALAGIAWGGVEELRDRPVMVSIINSLSPLQFSREMVGALMEFARYGQPCIVAPALMAGSTGPVRLPGLLALQNAEILAGLTLAQLVRPGVPILYGSASSVLDLRTGTFAIGAPELAAIVSATAQMARFYGLPCRSGGAITDSHVPDMQAGRESALGLVTAVRGGVHFMVHSCGILGSYMSMSFEKFLADEEFCGALRHLLRPLEITDEAIDLDTILEVGVGGEYLTHEDTYRLCRTEFFLPRLAERRSYDAWAADGRRGQAERAAELLEARLHTSERPDVPRDMERDLRAHVARRKG